MMALLQQLQSAGAIFTINNELNDVAVKLPSSFDTKLKEVLINNRDELKQWLIDKSKFEQTVYEKAPTLASYPLTDAQKQIWFMYQLNEGDHRYHMPAKYKVTGKYDIERFSEALNQLSNMHASLRTRFIETEEEVMQTIVAEQAISISTHDLSELDVDIQSRQLDELSANFRMKKFDLVNQAPLKVSWIKLSDVDSYLLFNIHHIVCDGWSLEVVLRDLLKIYESGITASSSSNYQYVDYAYWQNRNKKNRYVTCQVDYWKSHLINVPKYHDLCALPNATYMERGYDVIHTKYSSSLSTSIYGVAQANSLSPFMFMHACFSLMKSKLTGATTSCIGIPNSNRHCDVLEDVVGLFLSTQVLQVSTNFNTLGQYFEHVKHVHVAAHENKDVSFEKLVELTGHNSSEPISPLFQIFLNTNNVTTGHHVNTNQFSLAGLKFVERPYKEVSSKYDIDLSINFSSDGISLSWVYDKSLFSCEDISKLQSYLTNILEAVTSLDMAAISDTKIRSIPLLSDKELNVFEDALNSTDVPFEINKSMVTMFEEQVTRSATMSALTHNQLSINYEALNKKVNQLAHYLRKIGINKGDRVGICMDRSIDTVTAILAVLKCAACYVPMESSYPSVRLKHIVQDAKLTVLITDASSLTVVNNLPTQHIICLDNVESQKAIANQPETNLGIASGLYDPLYVYYTSGSTGKPKGVVGTQIGALNRFHWMWTKYPFNLGEKTCFKTAIGFVDAVWEMFGGLLAGVETVVLDNEDVINQPQLLKYIIDYKISRLILVPSLLQSLMQIEELFSTALKHLKIITVSGENLTTETVGQFQKFMARTLLLNLYGSSEVAADVTFFECDQLNVSKIGNPIANMRCYILDSNLCFLPKGAKGELYVSGPGVAKGYLGLESLTEERFLINPHDNGLHHHQILFKTGDIAYWDTNDQLVFSGRKDSQVKMLGKRIELTDIEENLRTHSSISEGIVLCRAHGEDRILVAFFTLKLNEGFVNIEQEIKDYLKQLLPEFMVPKVMVQLDQFPHLYNGKIDKQALLSRELFVPNEELNSLNTETETTLSNIWLGVLKQSNIVLYKETSFFDIGGNSLLVMTLSKKVNSQFGINLGIKEIFDSPTIESMSLNIDLQMSQQRIEENIGNNNNVMEMSF